jgi:hypothetical protein
MCDLIWYSIETTTNSGILAPALTIPGCTSHCFDIQVGITMNLALLRESRADLVQDFEESEITDNLSQSCQMARARWYRFFQLSQNLHPKIEVIGLIRRPFPIRCCRDSVWTR